MTTYNQGILAGLLRAAEITRTTATLIGRGQANAARKIVLETLNALAEELEAAARPNDPPPEAPEPEPVPPAPPPRPPVAPAAAVRRTVGALALDIGEEDERQIAQVKGYTGDECRDCGSFSMVRNGTCLKCENCGSTTGCS